MKALELKIPPVLVFILFAAIMNGLEKVDNGWLFMYIPLKIIWVSGLVIMSGYFGIAGVLEFRKAQTTVDPTKPEKASCIVDTGVFSITRNPMYVALFALLVAWGIWLEDGLSLFLCSLFVPYMTRFQIKPEEKVLESLFGDDYLVYKNKVSRWL